ncbi:hypothetical protein AC249_AIPGENE15800 [Exaiptasia diaphana]|nr:hypothetical protein AC249_AIPGENE15800 [Exaiptasia diaphana]
MGYSHFSLQFYGECWSGKNAEATFSDDGPSKECVDGGFKPCDQRPNVPCAGEGRTNFVYIATEKPALPTTQGPRCVDKYDICRHYASIGLCNDEYPLVLEYCVKSCGRC